MSEQLRELLEHIQLTAKTADGWEDGETFYKSAVESTRETVAEALALLSQPPAPAGEVEMVEAIRAFIAELEKHKGKPANQWSDYVAWANVEHVAKSFYPLAAIAHLPALRPQQGEVERMKGDGDWPEDFEDDNGNYINTCCECGSQFHGHKRRIVCKFCSSQKEALRPQASPEPVEEWTARERAAFEKTATDEGIDITRRANGVYDCSLAQIMRTGWNAAIAFESDHPAPAQASPVGDDLPAGMVRISKIIADFQGIMERFGDTCVYIKPGVSWGAAAMNRRNADAKAIEETAASFADMFKPEHKEIAQQIMAHAISEGWTHRFATPTQNGKGAERALKHLSLAADPSNETMQAVRTIRAALSAIPASTGMGEVLKADDVEWVVNDIAELSVKIGNQFFWLYKGTSLVYDGLHDEDEAGNRKPMRWRHVYKREFGECCHPIETLKAHGKTTLHDFPAAYGDPDDWQDMPLTQPQEADGGAGEATLTEGGQS